VRLYNQLQLAKSEEDVKDAYIKALGLKVYSKGLIDIRTDEIWLEAKDTGKNSCYAMFTQLLHYVQDALNKGEPVPPLLAVIDTEKAALMKSADVLPFLAKKTIKWGKSASQYTQQALDEISSFIGTYFVQFKIKTHEDEFITTVKSAIKSGDIIRTQITPDNLKQVFDKWVAMVGREIVGVRDEDYALLFFADIMHDGTVSTHAHLPAELMHKNGTPVFSLKGQNFDLGNKRRLPAVLGHLPPPAQVGIPRLPARAPRQPDTTGRTQFQRRLLHALACGGQSLRQARRNAGGELAERLHRVGHVLRRGQPRGQAQQTVLFSSVYGQGDGFYVTNENDSQAATIFTVRRLIRPTWLNDRDQFLQPTEPLTDEFKTDCLMWMLFNRCNRTASANDLEWNGKKWSIVNHFIPYSEEEVDAPDRFESDFMVQYLADKTLSPEATTVLDAGRVLWKTYFAQTDARSVRETYKLNRADVGWYQIRNALAERNKNGDTAPINFSVFETAYAALTEKLRPMVFSLGFLR